jgi:predicted Zn-dependent peptidase
MSVQFEKRPDGLTIGVDSMKEIETVTFLVLVGSGARNEENHYNGMSHFLEHMAFKGTKTRTALDVAEQFDEIGGRFNAYTSRESTVYYAKVLKSDSEIAVDILLDILQNSTYLQEEVEKERQVILQEIAQTNDTPDDIIFDYFQEIAYPEQSFGRSILGTEELIKNATREKIVEYANNNHFNDNILIAAAGKIEWQDLNKLVDSNYKGFSNLHAKYTEDVIYKGGFFAQEKDLEQVHVLYGYEGLSYKSDDFYTMQIMSLMLGGGMSSRLFQEIREKRGLVYSVGAFSSNYSDTGLFNVYGATTPENVNEFLKVSIDEIIKATNDFTENELKRAKNQVKASIMMSLESTSSRAEKLASNINAFGRYIATSEILNKIDAIDLNMIKSLLKNTITKSKPTLCAVGKVSDMMTYDDFAKKLSSF